MLFFCLVFSKIPDYELQTPFLLCIIAVALFRLPRDGNARPLT